MDKINKRIMESESQKPEAFNIASTEISRILKNENAVKIISKEITQYLTHLEGKLTIF